MVVQGYSITSPSSSLSSSRARSRRAASFARLARSLSTSRPFKHICLRHPVAGQSLYLVRLGPRYSRIASAEYEWPQSFLREGGGIRRVEEHDEDARAYEVNGSTRIVSVRGHL